MARRRSLVNAVPTLVLLLLFNVAVVSTGFLAARVFVVAFLLIVPGAALVGASSVRPSHPFVRLGLVVAAGLLLLMAVAVLASIALPHVGVADPLARGPMVVVLDYLVVGLAWAAGQRGDPIFMLLGDAVPRLSATLACVALAGLIVMAAGGAIVLDNGGGPGLAISALVGVGTLLIVTALRADRLPEWVLGAVLYTVGVALIYSYALRGDHLFGWDIQQEFRAFSGTMGAGAWHPAANGDPYRAMLSITALPAVLARVSGVSGVSVFRIVFPLVFALFPVLVYAIASRWVSRLAAFASAAFLVVQLPFSQQLPAITRQEIALVFFGVLVAVAFDDTIPLRSRRVLVVIGGASLAVTHYTTAYVTSLALVGTFLAFGVLRLVRRRPLRPVVSGPVVLAVVAAVLIWNVGVTHSTGNVTEFARQASERGPEFLANAKGRSLLTRWLIGNAPKAMDAREYAARVAPAFQLQPWFHGYPAAITSNYPLRDASVPKIRGPLPMVHTADSMLLVVVSQVSLALTVLGMFGFAWRRRRDRRPAALEFAVLGVVLLGFLGLMRVSGVAAEAYNQERAQIHVAAVLSIGFAAVCAWVLARRRGLGLTLIVGGIIVVYVASSGLGAIVGGGTTPVNLVNAGESYERFAVSDVEVATAQWIAAHREAGALVYTDRYGKLRLWSATSIPKRSLVDVLTPGTLDPQAYVFATEANVRAGHARGALGQDFALYEFPRAFLDSQKAVVYSTGKTLVYR